MCDLTLEQSEQVALRRILAMEPVPGRPLPTVATLETLAEIVHCDALGAVLADRRGCVLDEVTLPRDYYQDWPEGHSDGPLHLGLMHWSRHLEAARSCGALWGVTDGLAIGFRNGAGDVAQLWFDRERTSFSERDLSLVHLLMPVLQRLLRERPTPQLPPTLTVQERRVLMCVAAGKSNAQIAEDLFVAPSTVRKHLEHSYRKLGVNNRLAAVARLQGRDLPDLDLRERIDRLA